MLNNFDTKKTCVKIKFVFFFNYFFLSNNVENKLGFYNGGFF